MFGASVLLTVLISIAFMPETKGLDLESIGQALKDHRLRDISAFKKIKAVGILISGRYMRLSGHRTATSMQTVIELPHRTLAT